MGTDSSNTPVAVPVKEKALLRQSSFLGAFYIISVNYFDIYFL